MTTIKASEQQVKQWCSDAVHNPERDPFDYIVEQAVAFALGEAVDICRKHAYALDHGGNEYVRSRDAHAAMLEIRSAIPTKGEGHE